MSVVLHLFCWFASGGIPKRQLHRLYLVLFESQSRDRHISARDPRTLVASGYTLLVADTENEPLSGDPMDKRNKLETQKAQNYPAWLLCSGIPTLARAHPLPSNQALVVVVYKVEKRELVRYTAALQLKEKTTTKTIIQNSRDESTNVDDSNISEKGNNRLHVLFNVKHKQGRKCSKNARQILLCDFQ